MNGDNPHLVDGFPVLLDTSEHLLRQVHPLQVQENGVPQSAAFLPSEEHDYLLSTRREFIGDARAKAEHEVSGLPSAGTWSVTITDLTKEELFAFDDSNPPNPVEGHASIDFRNLSKGVRRKRASNLRSAALPADGKFPPLPAP